MDILSYGGGRQTAGMLAMIKLGELPRPDLVIFADTGGEVPETYAHIDRYIKPLLQDLEIRFEEVRQSGSYGLSLYDYAWKYRWIPQPWQRMCSEKFKVRPIYRFVRQWKGQPINMWIGISSEEAQRLKPALVKYIKNCHPLADRGLTIHDCEAALEQVGIPVPPKSACYFCPFQKYTRWQETNARHPELIEMAALLEERAMERSPGRTLTGKAPIRQYLMQGVQMMWEELLDAEAGCHSGHCFV